VRARILRTTVAVAMLAVFLLAIPLAIAVSALYNDETKQSLLADAVRAAATVPVLPLEAGDSIELPAATSAATISVYGSAGDRIAGEGPARADAATMDALRGRIGTASSGEIAVAIPIGAQEQVVGAVRAALPQSAVDARVHGTWLTMAGIGGGAVIVAALVALWQARRLSRPLDALAAAATRLGDGDFSARVPPSDVKEIDTVAKAMHSTSERLAGVLERERAFSADASHQLKTPLTALRIRLESALATPPAGHTEQIVASLEEIDRLSRSIDDLLRLARDVPTDRGVVDVSHLLERAAPRWRGRLQRAGRRLVLSTPEQLPRIAVSESAVQQIVEVLVDNAIVHGGGAVTVSAHALNGGLAVDVTDEGVGIGGAQNIFARRHSGGAGSGIGLALARSLAEAEQGRLSIVDPGPHPVFRLAFVASGSGANGQGDAE
jgi:signal transduction histidine kinase